MIPVEDVFVPRMVNVARRNEAESASIVPQSDISSSWSTPTFPTSLSFAYRKQTRYGGKYAVKDNTNRTASLPETDRRRGGHTAIITPIPLLPRLIPASTPIDLLFPLHLSSFRAGKAPRGHYPPRGMSLAPRLNQHSSLSSSFVHLFGC